MKASQTRRAREALVDVLEPGKGKALLHVLADGRASGHYKLSRRQLEEVPEVWQGTAASDRDEGKWWEAVDTMALDVSHNNIQTMPADIASLSETLELLNISHNPMRELPDHIGYLRQLKVLDVSGMELCQLPHAIAALPNLVKLFCQGCALVELPEGLGEDQPRLQQGVLPFTLWPMARIVRHDAHLMRQHGKREIDCSNNGLRQLPQGLRAASQLLSLKTSRNALHSFEGPVSGAWQWLTSLDLSHNSLTALPHAISCLTSLSALDASHNKLEEVPDGIDGCTSLIELLLSNNSIAAIPGSISQLQALRTLDLRANRLSSFPEAACELNVALLDLADNNLTTLPPKLGRMTSLRALPLSGNPLRGVRSTQTVAAILKTLRNRLEEPETAAPASTGACDENIRFQEGASVIALPGRALQRVPDQVWASASSMQRLDLSGNALSALPKEALAACTAMQVLDLSSNALTEWPLPASRLPCLRQLDLSGNARLFSAPQDALRGCADTLQSLSLSGTPAAGSLDVSWTPQLHTLHMARCALTLIPAGVFSLLSLCQLDLSSNSITQVRNDISKLTGLKELDLTNNDISGLPPMLGMLGGTLKVLRLEGNPLRSIRRPVLERGTAAVLEYLRGRIPAQ